MSQTKVRLCIYLLLFSCKASYALPDDKTKIMQLSADSVDFDQTSHKGKYLGHVELDQGSTHLRAEEASTESDANNQLMAATAKGTATIQAHVWTQTELKKPILHAYANEIRYYPNKQLIELIGNSKVEQGENTFKAPLIRYDMKNQHVLSEAKGSERTRILIKNGKLP